MLSKIKYIIVFSTFLVSGCAAFTPSTDHPRLLKAQEHTKNALSKLKSAASTDEYLLSYQRFSKKYKHLEERRRQNPDFELIDQYNSLAFKTNQAIAQIVKDQKKQLQNKINRMQNKITKLENKNTGHKKKISRQKKKIASLNKKTSKLQENKKDIAFYKETLDALEHKVIEKKNKLDRKNHKIKRLEDKVKHLERRLAYKTDKISNLKQKNDKIEDQLQKTLKKAQIQRKKGRIHITLNGKIQFNEGAANINNQAQEELNKISRIIDNKIDGGRSIFVHGHTDSLALTSSTKAYHKSNWHLGAHRAITVLRYLIDQTHVRPGRFKAVSHSRYDPVATNKTANGRAKNRRVVITIGKTSIKK